MDKPMIGEIYKTPRANPEIINNQNDAVLMETEINMPMHCDPENVPQLIGLVDSLSPAQVCALFGADAVTSAAGRGIIIWKGRAPERQKDNLVYICNGWGIPTGLEGWTWDRVDLNMNINWQTEDPAQMIYIRPEARK